METFRVVPSVDENNAPIFSVLVKRSYRICAGAPLQRLRTARPLRELDEYWEDGDPSWSTVKFESDLAPYKLATDVVFVGKAHAPDQQPTPQMDVAIQVGKYRKSLRVIGDRRCIFRPGQSPQFSEPQPFREMEIRYDLAYGGCDGKSLPGLEFHYPRNSMGRGFAISNTREVVDDLALPNLEDPSDLLTPERLILGEPQRWNQQPMPQGFGWYQKTWYPRCSFVGAMPGFVDVDEVMREELLNWVPKRQIALSRQFKLPSFSVRFNNGASWGLILPFLDGNEPVTLSGLTPSGELSFQLPGEIPRVALDIGQGQQELQPFLHTLCIRAAEGEVDLIWRGSLAYPGIDWLPQMTRLHAEVSA